MPGRETCILAAGQAVIDEAEGRLAEAANGHLAAAERWAAYGSPIEQGHSLTGAGRCLVALGRVTEAAEPLSQARDLFTPPGATLLIAEIDDLLAQTSARAG